MGSDGAAPHRGFCLIATQTVPEPVDISYHPKSASVNQQFEPLLSFNPHINGRIDTSHSVGIGNLQHVLPEDPDFNFAQFDSGEF